MVGAEVPPAPQDPVDVSPHRFVHCRVGGGTSAGVSSNEVTGGPLEHVSGPEVACDPGPSLAAASLPAASPLDDELHAAPDARRTLGKPTSKATATNGRYDIENRPHSSAAPRARQGARSTASATACPVACASRIPFR